MTGQATDRNGVRQAGDDHDEPRETGRACRPMPPAAKKGPSGREGHLSRSMHACNRSNGANKLQPGRRVIAPPVVGPNISRSA